MEDESTGIVFDRNIGLDDLLLIYFEDDTSLLGNISSIDDETVTINERKLNIDSSNHVLLKTDEYQITDIELLREIDMKQLDDATNDIVDNDVHPKIETEIVEDSDKIYTLNERAEDLMSVLIRSFEAHDKKYLIENISDIVSEIKSIFNSENFDILQTIDKNKFKEIQNFIKNKQLPEWLIPVTNEKNRLYLSESNDDPETDDYVGVDYESEMERLSEELDDSKQDYKTRMNILYKNSLSPLRLNDTIEDGYRIHRYNRDFLRDCLLNPTCTGVEIESIPFNPPSVSIGNKYRIDVRRNRKSLNIPIVEKRKNIITKIIDDKHLNITGLLLLSDSCYSKINMYSNVLTLAEKCVLQYNIRTNIRTRYKKCFSKSFKTIHMNDIDKPSNYYKPNTTYLYSIDDTIDTNKMNEYLQNYIPNVDTIFENTNDKTLFDYMFNFTDFSKIFIKYNLTVHNISSEVKQKLIKILESNKKKYTEWYSKNYKQYVYKKYDVVIKQNTPLETIQMVKRYIDNELNIVKRNYYLQKFIDRFTIKPDESESNQLWLLNRFDNTRLLCKHYLYSVNILTDNTAYKTMIAEYGDTPHDGYIYCKNCGEFLSNTDFSVFSGFDENDRPIFQKSLEKENDDEVEIDILDMDSYEYLQIISDTINVKLTESDIIKIDDIYKSFNNDVMIEIRYQMVDIYRYHQLIQESKLDKKKLAGIIKTINRFIGLTICVLIFIQTSTQPYRIKTKLELLELTTNDYNTLNIRKIINTDTIDKLISVFYKSIYKRHKNTTLGKSIAIYRSEIGNPNITSPIDQFKNLVCYIVSPVFPSVLERIETYREYVGISGNRYIKNYWTTYRPLPTNDTIRSINRVLSENRSENERYFRRQRGILQLENISIIQTVESYSKTRLFEIFDITNNELLTNTSFLKIFKYVVGLYGKIKSNDFFNLTVAECIRSLDDSTVGGYFRDIGYKKDEFASDLNFTDLREVVFKIVKHYKTTKNSNILQLFVHKSFNNLDLILLNSLPKRIYSYKPVDVYPNVTFNDLREESPLKRIFDVFCYDINGKIIRKSKESLLVGFDINVQNTVNLCEDEIVPSNENFNKIIIKNNIQNQIIDSKIDTYDRNRNIEFFSTPNGMRLIKYLNETVTYQNKTLTDLLSEIEKNHTKLDKRELESNLKKISDNFSDIQSQTTEKLKKICDYLTKTDNIDEKHKRMIKTNELNRILNDIFIRLKTPDCISIVKNIQLLLSRLSTNYTTDPSISKFWKLTENNRDLMKTYFENNEMLLHNNVFEIYKKQYNGFYNYSDSSTIMNCYYDLLRHIHSYTRNIDDLIGQQNDLYDKSRETVLYKYLLIGVLNEFYEYILKLETETIDPCPDSANEIFKSLSSKTELDNLESVKILSDLLLDIVINMIQEYTDPAWIHMDDDMLSRKLRMQREREKQKILSNNRDESWLKKQLQDNGITNNFAKASRDNLEYRNSEEYQMMTEAEREFGELNIMNRADEPDIQINIPSEQEEVFEQDIEEPLEEDDSNFE